MLNGPESSATGIEAATMISITISHQVSCYSWLFLSLFLGVRRGKIFFTCTSIIIF